MSFLDKFAKNMSGKSTNSNYQSYGNTQQQPMRVYQCQCCGRQERVRNPQQLSTNACPSRGVDSFGRRQKHIWREL